VSHSRWASQATDYTGQKLNEESGSEKQPMSRSKFKKLEQMTSPELRKTLAKLKPEDYPHLDHSLTTPPDVRKPGYINLKTCMSFQRMTCVQCRRRLSLSLSVDTYITYIYLCVCVCVCVCVERERERVSV